MRRQPSKKDYVEALRAAESERDAWRHVWLNPIPDFTLEVFIPGREHDTREYWYLHASHRYSGPVLRITDSEGYQQVYWLEALPEPMRTVACAYRRAALAKCHGAYRAYLNTRHVAAGGDE